MPDPICAAVILNYNGRGLLEENLSSVVAAARKVDGGCEVIVLDNLSTDDSVDFVRANYSGVTVEIAPGNRILFSYNELCRRIHHKYVVILNNDIRLHEDCLALLLPHCAAPDVFAVSALLLDAEGKEITRSRALAESHRGLVRVTPVPAKEVTPTLDAGGGCAVFDREKFVAMGGFDELYWPFYWEDTDLSYTAWKRGFRVLFEPRSIMYHRHAATILRNRKNEAIYNRNAHFFFWKNITTPALMAKHIAWLVILIPWRGLRGKWTYVRGVWAALPKIPRVLKRRAEMKKLWTRSDAEVWALVAEGNGASSSPGQAIAPTRHKPADTDLLSS